jgi:hypothetical protein
LTKNQLHGSFTPVNAILLICGVISASTLAWRVKAGSRGGIRLKEDDEVGDIEGEGEGGGVGEGGARVERMNGRGERGERGEVIREEEED